MYCPNSCHQTMSPDERQLCAAVSRLAVVEGPTDELSSLDASWRPLLLRGELSLDVVGKSLAATREVVGSRSFPFLKSAILVVTSLSRWVPGLFSWLPICTERVCEDVAHNATFTAFVCAGCCRFVCMGAVASCFRGWCVCYRS